MKFHTSWIANTSKCDAIESSNEFLELSGESNDTSEHRKLCIPRTIFDKLIFKKWNNEFLAHEVIDILSILLSTFA